MQLQSLGLTHHHVILAMPACADLPAVCHHPFSVSRAASTFLSGVIALMRARR